MATRHDPTRLGKYVNVHRGQMADPIRLGVVVRDASDFTDLPNQVLIDGNIYLRGNIRIEIEKTLTKLRGAGDHTLVQTVECSYHAVVAGKNILHYDWGAWVFLTSIPTTRSAQERGQK